MADWYLLNIRWKDLSGAPVEKFARRESSVGAPDRSRVPPMIEKIRNTDFTEDADFAD